MSDLDLGSESGWVLAFSPIGPCSLRWLKTNINGLVCKAQVNGLLDEYLHIIWEVRGSRLNTHAHKFFFPRIGSDNKRKGNKDRKGKKERKRGRKKEVNRKVIRSHRFCIYFNGNWRSVINQLTKLTNSQTSTQKSKRWKKILNWVEI